jgi:acyl-CoA thioesterase FadM
VQHAHRHIVSLADTDAAGVVFTARAIEIAHRSFEAWLSSHGAPIADMLAGRLPAMPIVRVEADLHAPMRVGDAVEGELDNGENLLLCEGCFVSDCDNEVARGEICHGAGGSGFK